ncbi:MAG: glycerate kinase [Bryobacterales bacterium]|nr:glycerate kinase [Bryobacterales bacterium]
MNLRKDAATMFRAALKAADPIEAVRKHLHKDGDWLVAGRKKYRLSAFGDVYVLGAGKASVAMAQAVERILGARVRFGFVNTKYGHGGKLKRVKVKEAGHPVPDENGVAGARELVGLARQARAGDLVIFVVSGGASALTPLPAPPITLGEKQRVTQDLLACGANIHEMNTVRKHISLFKGGQLAREAAPATLITLMLSDVIGDSMDVIGSGPTVPDESTFGRAWEILSGYGIVDKLPESVRERLQAGVRGEIAETPKPGDEAFAKTQNLVVGSNRLAVDAAARKARELGYKPLVLSTFLEGETRDVARVHAGIAKEILASGRPVGRPACVISGGETTVTLRGSGLGGRNQEFAAAAALYLDGVDGVVVLSGGTDGTDGPTDAAGAIADGRTVARLRAKNLSAAAMLADNDSYHMFEALSDLIKTGPTGTNVMDVRLVLVG